MSGLTPRPLDSAGPKAHLPDACQILAAPPGSPGPKAALPRPPLTVPVVNLGVLGGSCTDIGKVADAGEDCARDRGRWPPKDTGMPAASMEAW